MFGGRKSEVSEAEEKEVYSFDFVVGSQKTQQSKSETDMRFSFARSVFASTLISQGKLVSPCESVVVKSNEETGGERLQFKSNSRNLNSIEETRD